MHRGKHTLSSRRSEGETLGNHPYRLALPQLLLGAVKVKIHIETLHKLCDWVFICVRLLWEWERKHHSNKSLTKSLSHIRLKKKNLSKTFIDLTCWMTFTKSLSTCLRFRTSLLVMTAVVRYLRICGHIVWMAFRYLKNTEATQVIVSLVAITTNFTLKVTGTTHFCAQKLCRHSFNSCYELYLSGENTLTIQL